MDLDRHLPRGHHQRANRPGGGRRAGSGATAATVITARAPGPVRGPDRSPQLRDKGRALLAHAMAGTAW